MKHLHLFNLILFLSLSANSQTKVSVNGGLVIGNARWAWYNSEIGYNSVKAGFKMGLSFRLPVSKKINFEPEVNFVSKGVIIAHPGDLVTSQGTSFYVRILTQTMTLNSFEVPLNLYFNYKFISSNILFFIGGGPVIGIGIDGVIKEKGIEQTNSPAIMARKFTARKKIVFDGLKPSTVASDNEDFHLSQFELGANVTAGVELRKKYIIKVMFNQTITDLDIHPNVSFRPNYFGFSFGYYLKRHKSLRKSNK